jgi:hypothetical protein
MFDASMPSFREALWSTGSYVAYCWLLAVWHDFGTKP